MIYKVSNTHNLISVRRGHRENDQRLVEQVQKHKNQNLIVYFLLKKALLARKIQFEEYKFKIECLRTQLDFF
jgi:hypothetical protein